MNSWYNYYVKVIQMYAWQQPEYEKEERDSGRQKSLCQIKEALKSREEDCLAFQPQQLPWSHA